MTPMKEKAQCVLWIHRTKSPILFNASFGGYGRGTLDLKKNKQLYEKFIESGSVGDFD